MKTKQALGIFMMLLCFFVTTSVVCSCNNESDDAPNYPTNKMVGTWRYDFGTNSYSLLTFTSDGDGHCEEFEDGEFDHEWDFFYLYDDNASSLTLIRNNKSYDYSITWLSDKRFRSDIADGGSVWTKLK